MPHSAGTTETEELGGPNFPKGHLWKILMLDVPVFSVWNLLGLDGQH
jgi:hypothetical protein